MFTTLCKYECMILSHDGSKILTACRMLQISIAHRQMKAKIHSFPTMYILGGVDVVEMGQIKVFVQELGLKTSISAEQNLDLLTLAGSGRDDRVAGLAGREDQAVVHQRQCCQYARCNPRIEIFGRA